MTALPSATTATASAATEGDVKSFLTGTHDYLSGLFGDTGVAADAREALGVTAVTSGNIITALGYTPADASAVVSKNMGGSYPIGAIIVAGRRALDATRISAGGTIAGSDLRPLSYLESEFAYGRGEVVLQPTGPAGTWKNITNESIMFCPSSYYVTPLGTWQRTA